MTKAIKMSDLKVEPRRPKTKAWDPSKVISTGNIERVREANKKAARAAQEPTRVQKAPAAGEEAGEAGKDAQKGQGKAGGQKGKGGKKSEEAKG